MAITGKQLMGGDKMVRPGGVKTMQDEIDAGLRDKNGREFSKEELADNAKEAEETTAQPTQEETQPEKETGDQGGNGGQPSESDGGGQQEAGPDTIK